MKKHVLWFWVVLFALTVQLSAQTVYTTKTGEKYHTGDCHYLSQSKFAIELKDAIAKNYEACKVCRPAQDITVPTLKETNLDEKPDPETTISTTTRCSALTQKGARCKNTATNANGKCWVHGG